MRFWTRVRKKFRHAFHGLFIAFTTDNSFKAHAVFSVVALALSIGLRLDLTGWALIFVAIGLVIVAELFNTAIEYLVRMFTSEYHALAEKLLDISAGAVLFASFIAVVLASLVFIPRLWEMFF